MWTILCVLAVVMVIGPTHWVNGSPCGQPDVPANSEVTLSNHGTVARYRCKEGFTLSGNSVRRCRNGIWTEHMFSCDEITCKYVDTPTNGRIKNEVTYQIGGFVEFECNIGYKLHGDRKYLCGIDGEWRYVTAAKCKPITCPALSDIPYGSIFQDSSDGIRDNYLSEAEYTCRRGYRIFGKKLKHVRTCELNGQWSGSDPYCEAPVCDEISPFDGGTVRYSGGKRTENALAFLICNEGYSFYPSKVEYTRCKETITKEFSWIPEPTKCMKKHKVVVPEHCTTSSKGELKHLEFYVLTPSEGYEFYGNNAYLDNFNGVKITNINGKLDPPVPQCVPERCKTWRTACDHLSVQFLNGSSTDVKVDSHTSYNLILNDKYEFEGRNYININSIKRRCEYGHFLNVPLCTEKSCHLTNNDLVLQSLWSASLVKVAHNKEVEVSCKSQNHEMYRSSSGKFLKPFKTLCSYGQFVKEVNSLQCLPKRCNVGQLKHVSVHYMNGNRANGMVKSHVKYRLSLLKNYEFDGDNYINIISIERRCENGQFLNVPSIIEKRCYLTNAELKFQTQQTTRMEHNRKDEVRCKSERHAMYRGTYLKPFSVRCQYGQFNYDVNSIKCVPKPCDTNLLMNTQVLYTDGTPAVGWLESDDKLYKLMCEADHEFQRYPHVEYIERQCEYGEFRNVSECIGKQCTVLYPDKNVVQYRKKETNIDIPDNTKVAHLTEVLMTCSSGYELFNISSDKFPSKDHRSSTSTTCIYGELSDLDCREERCKIEITSNAYCYFKKSNLGCMANSFNLRSGRSINLLCKGNYTLQRKDKMINERSSQSETMTCSKGKLSPEYECYPNPCQRPELSNATTNYTNNDVTSGDKIVYTCDNRHHVDGTKDKTQWIGECIAGSINNVPTGCIPDNCEMIDVIGGMLKEAGSGQLFTGTIIPHGLQLQLECSEGFELVNSKNEIIKNTLANLQCDRGILTDKYYCKRCIQTVNDGNNTNSTENTNRNTAISKHVQDNMICVEYNDDGCTINKSSTYKYFDAEGNIIEPPHTVKSGTQLMVECYDPIVIYEYYDVTPSENITCTDGVLPPVVMECQDILTPPDPCETFQLSNGKVSKFSIEKYKVTCDPGYKLNIPNALNEQCICSNGEVECVAGQKLKCEAENCRIPLDSDQRLSVYENVGSSTIVLSPGETVKNYKYAIFNCSNVIEHKYEPFNRRFKCVRGQWIEAERNPEWTFGNNGTFPECREAICDPPCSNGGICHKDDECRCSRNTAGLRCEIMLCDASCKENGGECVKPGVCGNCPNGRRGSNCEIEITCELPAVAARYKNNRKIFSPSEMIYSSDMHCLQGYQMSSIKTMTCQPNGTWTGIIKCLRRNFKYVVRLLIGDESFAGTSDNIFLVLHGEHEQTTVLQMSGGVHRNRIHEIEFRSLDVRPVQKVVLTKDEGMWGGDVLISYVSIFIDVDDEYYVFRHPPQETAAWLDVSSVLEFTLSKHPEHCIYSYEQGVDRKPKHRRDGIREGFVSLRECKQRCVTTSTSVTCKSIFFMPSGNWGGYCYLFRHFPESDYFTRTTNRESRKNYKSYKRICTNHGNV